MLQIICSLMLHVVRFDFFTELNNLPELLCVMKQYKLAHGTKMSFPLSLFGVEMYNPKTGGNICFRNVVELPMKVLEV
jgi:hypothetical protein